MDSRALLICGAVLLGLLSTPATSQMQVPTQPNFLVIVVDDLGWSDLSFLGSEIRTPNVDNLSNEGMLLSNFYVAPTCSPTRAMLLTGVNNHAAGLGTMHGLASHSQKGHIQYDGQLHNGVVTVAELLQDKGYATLMSGKWHLGLDAEQHPNNRGFDRSFGLLEGGASHFADQRQIHRSEQVTYLEDGEPISLPEEFYSTHAYTDKLIDYIKSAGEQPFFAYLAYTAPHDPLQVPNEWLDRYDGVYDDGPEVVKQRRAKRLVELGLLPSDARLAEPQNLPSWLDGHKKPWAQRNPREREVDSRRMEIYAAMVEIVDQQIGRLIGFLRQTNKLDDTYVLFMSDNGASAGTPYTYPDNERHWVDENYDLTLDKMGQRGSFTTMGREWSNHSNMPFRMFKATVAEGGVRSPLVISGPGIAHGTIRRTPSHVTDIVPTISALANIHPSNEAIYKGKLLPQGETLTHLFSGEAREGNRFLVTELFGNRMVRYGDWKAVYLSPPLGTADWELFDIERDPGATRNLADKHPTLVTKMARAYQKYAEQNQVIDPDRPMRPNLVALYEGHCTSWCRTKFTFAEVMIDPTRRLIASVMLTLLVLTIGWWIFRKLRLRPQNSY